jgi:guanylate kinase
MSSSEAAGQAAPPGNRGKLIVISGPSGAGKSSICQALLEQLPRAVWSVSATTRPRRRGEVPGESYEFVSRSEFERRRAAGLFLEWAEYCGELYGTPRAMVEEAIRGGDSVVLEIDVQGGAQVAARMPESIRIFVLPPDMASLKARLEGRQTEAEAQMRGRLAKADGEIAFARDCGAYDHFVTNDVLEETVATVRHIIEEQTNA